MESKQGACAFLRHNTFKGEVHMAKLNEVRNLFDENGIDGLLITSSYNRFYMTGFTGTSGVALISKQKALFITDFRYIEQANKQASDYEIVRHEGPITLEIAAQAQKLGITKLGFEQEHVSFSQYTDYQRAISAELVPISAIVEKLRLIKSVAEIKILKEAAQIADAAFEHILTFIRSGVTEIEVSNELEFFMRKQGATSSSFDIIVASGVRSALPHGVATDKVIERGDFVTMDYGALYKGYISDITRTIAVGQPSDDLKNIYNIVLEAQLAGMAGLKSGLTGKQGDALTRDIIAAKGYGEYFGHSTGHGIGVEVHEGPMLSSKSEIVLQPNMVVTVEPGVYIPNLGGVRIEDDTLITETGNESLTHATKELIIL